MTSEYDVDQNNSRSHVDDEEVLGITEQHVLMRVSMDKTEENV